MWNFVVKWTNLKFKKLFLLFYACKLEKTTTILVPRHKNSLSIYWTAKITDTVSSVYTRFSAAFVRSFKPLRLTAYFTCF